MITRVLLLISLLVVPLLAVGCIQPSDVTVPVEVKGANDIGAIAFDLVYDPALLKVARVSDVGFSKGAEAGYNSNTPGRLIVVVQNAPAMNGDGTLVEVRFDILEHEGQSALTLENVVAKSVTTGDFVSTQTAAGSVAVKDASHVAPQIVFGQ